MSDELICLPVIALSTNGCWNAVNFRKSLMIALQSAGYKVVVLAPKDDYTDRLMALGVDWIDIPMQAKGRNPLKDLATMATYFKVLARLRPAVYLGFTIKPNVYGSLACRALGIAAINNIAGLGTLFDRDNLSKALATTLYRIALRGSRRVFFQNNVDEAYFHAQRILRADTPTEVLPGSGVDANLFCPSSAKSAATAGEDTQPFRFIMSSRLLWAKGVGEYIEAARRLAPLHPHAEWHLMGFCGNDADAVSQRQIDSWVAEGLIRYLGISDHVHSVLPAYDCFVLPSYYNEGTPRSLLEAAACGLPIITTDWKGCRDVVLDQATGLLCKARDMGDLAAKMSTLLEMSHAARARMGAASRERTLARFSDALVIQRYLAAIGEQAIPTYNAGRPTNGERDAGQTG